jgi:2-iminobutanoate/2-iminopropanoate deaminase
MKNPLKLLLIIFMISIGTCMSQQRTDLEFLKSKEEKKKDLPFSDAVRVGNTLYLAGQIGMDHTVRKLVSGGIKAETAQALNNIKSVLEANGSDLGHVVKCTVILSDINNFGDMNEIYKTFFKDNFPARTTFSASLVAGATIEIECIAVIK